MNNYILIIGRFLYSWVQNYDGFYRIINRTKKLMWRVILQECLSLRDDGNELSHNYISMSIDTRHGKTLGEVLGLTSNNNYLRKKNQKIIFTSVKIHERKNSRA